MRLCLVFQDTFSGDPFHRTRYCIPSLRVERFFTMALILKPNLEDIMKPFQNRRELQTVRNMSNRLSKLAGTKKDPAVCEHLWPGNELQCAEHSAGQDVKHSIQKNYGLCSPRSSDVLEPLTIASFGRRSLRSKSSLSTALEGTSRNRFKGFRGTQE